MVSHHTIEVLLLVTLWYSSAVVSVITSKATMIIAPVPFVLCLTQFFTASVVCCILYLFKHWHSKKSKWHQMLYITPIIAIVTTCYTAGFIFTNIAFSLGNANSVETVKSTEPVSSVILGQMFCPEYCSWLTYSSLIPILMGVSLACYGDSTFPLWGVLFAFISNICFSGRAVATKKLQVENNKNDVKSDEILLFGQVSVLGLLLIFPFAMYFDFGILNEVFMRNSGTDMNHGSAAQSFDYMLMSLLNGLAYSTYNLTSFLVLTRTNIVTHAVLNAFRRVVIIIGSAAYFNIHLNAMNMYGVLIAVFGVIWFGISKNKSNSKYLSSRNGDGNGDHYLPFSTIKSSE